MEPRLGHSNPRGFLATCDVPGVIESHTTKMDQVLIIKKKKREREREREREIERIWGWRLTSKLCVNNQNRVTLGIPSLAFFCYPSSLPLIYLIKYFVYLFPETSATSVNVISIL